MERLKRRAMSSSIMKEIEKEYAETPEEIKVDQISTRNQSEFLIILCFVFRITMRIRLSMKLMSINTESSN